MFMTLLGGLQSVFYTRILSQHIRTYFYGMKISVLTILTLEGKNVIEKAYYLSFDKVVKLVFMLSMQCTFQICFNN